MDSFSLFQLKPAPTLVSKNGQTVTRQELKQAYIRLQAVCHPDAVALASQAMQTIAAKKSADISSAYKVLSDDLARVKLWLTMQGFDIEKQTIKPDISVFEAQMELNELFESVQSGNSSAKQLKSRLAEMRQVAMDWFERIEHVTPQLQESCLRYYSQLALVTRLDSKLKDLRFQE